MYARRRYIHGAELDDYRTNEGPPTVFNFTRSNPSSMDRRITLSNGTKPPFARTTSQQIVHQSNASLTVPRTLHTTPSIFSDHAGMNFHLIMPFLTAHTYIESHVPTEPFNHISGGMSSSNRDSSSIRPYSLPANPLHDRSWFTNQPTRTFPIASSLLCSSGDIIRSNS